MKSLSRNRLLDNDEDDSSDVPLGFMNYVYRSSFWVVATVITIILVYKTVKYFQRHKWNGFKWYVIEAEFMSAVSRSMAVYISRNKAIQGIFYVYGLWLISFSYAFTLFVEDYVPIGPSTNIFILSIELTIFEYIQHPFLILFFLVIMMGDKNQIIEKIIKPSRISNYDSRSEDSICTAKSKKSMDIYCSLCC